MVAKVNEDQDTDSSLEDGDDAPLTGALAKAVKKIVAKGKERGYVTYDEINRLLPPAEYTSDQIDETMAMLSDIGINLVEAEESADEDAEKKAVAKPEGEEEKAPRSASISNGAAD